MTRLLSPARTLVVLLAGAAAYAPGAWAQAGAPVGAIAFAPALAATQSVPTLSQWGLAALALLLALGSRRWLRGPGAARAVALGLLAGAALLSTPWVGQALAQPVSALLLDNPAGGTIDLPDHPDFERPFADYMHAYEVRNVTDRPLRITAITVTAAHRITGPLGDTRCTTGRTLAPLASCQIEVGRPH